MTGLEKEFLRLRYQWVSEYGFHSNPHYLYNNPPYDSIVALGWDIVPTLIEDFDYSDWSDALKRITGIDPVTEENYGNWEGIKQDWRNWYYRKVRDEKIDRIIQ